MCVFYLCPESTDGFLQSSGVVKDNGRGQGFYDVFITHDLMRCAQQGVDNHHLGVREFECACGAAQV